MSSTSYYRTCFRDCRPAVYVLSSRHGYWDVVYTAAHKNLLLYDTTLAPRYIITGEPRLQIHANWLHYLCHDAIVFANYQLSREMDDTRYCTSFAIDCKSRLTEIGVDVLYVQKTPCSGS